MYELFNPRALSALLGSILLLASRPAAGATVVFNCSGTISEFGGQPVFDNSVAVGTPYSATFFVDTHAQDLDAFSNEGWDYVDTNPQDEAVIQFGNYSVGPNPSGYGVSALDGSDASTPADQMRWQSENSIGSGLTVWSTMAWLEDDTGKALTGKGLPPVGPGMTDISMWNYRQFSFGAYTTADAIPCGWLGSIDAFSVHTQESSVPEPGSLALLAMAGLPGLGILLRKRQG